MTDDDDIIRAAEAAVYAMCGEFDEQTRTYLAMAADAGELATWHALADGSFRVELAGVVLGQVRFSNA
jgi:hypothetical protein